MIVTSSDSPFDAMRTLSRNASRGVGGRSDVYTRSATSSEETRSTLVAVSREEPAAAVPSAAPAGAPAAACSCSSSFADDSYRSSWLALRP